MRLYYIANIRIPTEKAHGYQIMKTCEAFSVLGADVLLLIPEKHNPVFQGSDPLKQYHIKTPFNVKFLRCPDPSWLIPVRQGLYTKFQTVIFIIRLAAFFLKERPPDDAVLYTRDEYLIPVLRMFSRRIYWEVHALSRRRRFFARLYSMSAGIVALTASLKKNLVTLGINGSRVSICPDAVDVDIFDIALDTAQARAQLDLPNDSFILGFTGSLKTKNVDKGLSVILQSLARVIQSKKNALLLVVGGSRLHIAEYRKQAEFCGVLENVRFIEKVTLSTLAVYQKACDVLLMPFPSTEHYAYFMSPLKMFEYMASGRPIVASDLPSIREVLTDESAFFVKPGDSEDLSEVILYVAAHLSEAGDRGSRARRSVSQFTWNRRAERIMSFIDAHPKL